jgi:hypothetical protein
MQFRGSIAPPARPLSTLRCALTERQRMTRGHRDSLRLRCRALTSPTPCRFIPALSGKLASPARSLSSPHGGGTAPSFRRRPDRPSTRAVASALPRMQSPAGRPGRAQRLHGDHSGWAALQHRPVGHGAGSGLTERAAASAGFGIRSQSPPSERNGCCQEQPAHFGFAADRATA